MSVKYVVIHRRDENNVGDMASEPLQYFLEKNEYQVVDITDFHVTDITPNVPIILGGGGLIANEHFGEILRDALNGQYVAIRNLPKNLWDLSKGINSKIKQDFFSKLNPLVKEYLDKIERDKSPRIIWGAGHNGPFAKKYKGDLDYPEFLAEYDLVGIRDTGQLYEWTPCASCMHPAFDKKYTIKNDIIWFEHKKQLIKSTEFGPASIPRFVNSGNNFEQTIELLGSANVIVTNSYHGAYWGTLLNKKVIVVEPWSSKFNAMRHSPYFVGKGETIDKLLPYIHNMPQYPHALKECRDATRSFWKKVQSL